MALTFHGINFGTWVQEKAMTNNIVSILCPHFLFANRIKTRKIHKGAKKYRPIIAGKTGQFLILRLWYCIVIKYVLLDI